MAFYRTSHILDESIYQTASRMLTAAMTAPKGKGRNTLEGFIITGDDITILAQAMHQFGENHNISFFHRDADNLNVAKAVVIIGTEIKTLGLNEYCQLCGFRNCEEKEKHPNTPCIFNTGDLHLALGSAVAIAAQDYVDNRIMFSIGKAVLGLNWFQKDIKIAMGIPLAAEAKNPFFDRK